jgi:hypothetical protein
MKPAAIVKLSAVIPFCCAVIFLCRCQPTGQRNTPVLSELALVKQNVEQQLAVLMDGIAQQVAGFAGVVASDREFSMKMLVDKDKSAPEVTDMAQKYLAPMALTTLSVTDSHYVLLSCGHFPANAGTVFEAARLLGEKPAFIMDNVKGQTMLTLQAKSRFKILDSVFFACGGLIADSGFLSKFTCWPGYSIFITQGKSIIGREHVESISGIINNTILLNNVTYPATAITLPFDGTGEAPVLTIICNKPCQ